MSEPWEIVAVKRRGASLTIHYGTNTVKDLSDGQFPVELWRINLMPGGAESEHKRTCTKDSTLTAGIKRAGAGWRAGAIESWVELRTPASRVQGYDRSGKHWPAAEDCPFCPGGRNEDPNTPHLMSCTWLKNRSGRLTVNLTRPTE